MDEEPIVNDSGNEEELVSDAASFIVDKYVDIDIGSPTVPVNIYCTQLDSAWRWRFRLFKDGQRFTVANSGTGSGTSSISISGIYPSGRPFSSTGGAINNEIMLTDSQHIITNEAGITRANLIYAYEGKIIATHPINFVCAPICNASNTSAPVSLTAYQQLLLMMASTTTLGGETRLVIDSSLQTKNAGAEAYETGYNFASVRANMMYSADEMYGGAVESMNFNDMLTLVQNEGSNPIKDRCKFEKGCTFNFNTAAGILDSDGHNCLPGEKVFSASAKKTAVAGPFPNSPRIAKIYIADNVRNTYNLQLLGNNGGIGYDVATISSAGASDEVYLEKVRAYAKYLWVIVRRKDGADYGANEDLTNVLKVDVYTTRSYLPEHVRSLEVHDSLSGPYDFVGKTVKFFGDSITAGVYSYYDDDTVKSDGISFTETWAPLFANKAGFNFTRRIGGNYNDVMARSGSHFYVSQSHSVEAITTTIDNYAATVTDASAAPDYIFIAGGSNDYGDGCPLGVFGDTSQTGSFYGAVDHVCETLSAAKFANTHVIFITPIHRLRMNSNPASATSEALSKYAYAIYEEATAHGFDVVDGFSLGFPMIPDAYSDVMMPDKLHPSLAGHKVYADALYAKMPIQKLEPVYEAVYSAYPAAEANGANIHITDGADNIPVVALKANIRSTTGVSSLTFSHSDADTSNQETIQFTFPTVSGGICLAELDILTGVLKYWTYTTVNDLSSFTWTQKGSSGGKIGVTTNLSSNYYRHTVKMAAASYTYKGTISASSQLANPASFEPGLYTLLGSGDEENATSKLLGVVLNESASLPSGKLIYTATSAAETTVQLDPHEIRTFLGENTFSANCENLSLKYRADSGLYIDRKLSELQALILESIGG